MGILFSGSRTRRPEGGAYSSVVELAIGGRRLLALLFPMSGRLEAIGFYPVLAIVISSSPAWSVLSLVGIPFGIGFATLLSGTGVITLNGEDLFLLNTVALEGVYSMAEVLFYPTILRLALIEGFFWNPSLPQKLSSSDAADPGEKTLDREDIPLITTGGSLPVPGWKVYCSETLTFYL